MHQVELIWPGDIKELQDYWQKLLCDVSDLVITVGMEDAEAMIDQAIGEEWRGRGGYGG